MRRSARRFISTFRGICRVGTERLRGVRNTPPNEIPGTSDRIPQVRRGQARHCATWSEFIAARKRQPCSGKVFRGALSANRSAMAGLRMSGLSLLQDMLVGLSVEQRLSYRCRLASPVSGVQGNSAHLGRYQNCIRNRERHALRERVLAIGATGGAGVGISTGAVAGFILVADSVGTASFENSAIRRRTACECELEDES